MPNSQLDQFQNEDEIGRVKKRIHDIKQYIAASVGYRSSPHEKHPSIDKLLSEYKHEEDVTDRGSLEKVGGETADGYANELRGDRDTLNQLEKDPNKIVPHISNAYLNKFGNLMNSLNKSPKDFMLKPIQITKIPKQKPKTVKKSVMVKGKNGKKSKKTVTKVIKPDKQMNDNLLNSINNEIAKNNTEVRHAIPKLNVGKMMNTFQKAQAGELIPSKRQAIKMASDALKWANCNKVIKRFKNIDKYEPNTCPYKYHGKTYYLPYGDVDMGNAIRDISNYQKSINEAKAYKKESSAFYGKLTNKIVRIDPHETPQEKSLAKARGNYALKIQQDRIWQEYHHNEYERIKYRYNLDNSNYAVSLDDKQDKWNKFQLKINKFYRRHGANGSAKWRRLCHLRNKYRREFEKMANRQPRKMRNLKALYRVQLRMYNRFKNRADRLAKNYGSFAKRTQINEYKMDTIRDLHSDPRFTHYGYLRPVHPDQDDDYIYFMITDESPTYETNVSSNPVEWGSNITTGTQMQATSIAVQGYIFDYGAVRGAGNGSDDQPEEHSQKYGEFNHRYFYNRVLKQAEQVSDWAKAGAEMYYCGQDTFPTCVINEWNPDYSNSGDDGSMTSLSFSMTLTGVNYFSSNEDSRSHGSSKRTGKKARKTGKNHKRVGNKSSRHPRIGAVTAKAGTTYYAVAKAKHVPVSQVEKLNHYRSRGIPIGSKIKY